MTDLITGSPNTFSQVSPTALRSSTGQSGWSTNKIIQIILIFLVLALLGLNVFAYLAKGTDYITHILEFITGNVAQKAGGVLTTSGKGVELAADVVGGAIQDAGAVLGRELEMKRGQLWKNRDQGIQRATDQRQLPGINKFPQYEPDKVDSGIQKPQKPGFCYIGTDRGYRSCISVGQSDKCMSGKIFPTMKICINPTLRQ